MMTLLARWFEPVSPSQDYQRADYIMLWLVLAVGVFLRFWGLGNVGLHGDEETMAMPAMSILRTGEPLLPSGMYYARALINVYLMSGSASLFGESEWAFRLPSAVVGSFTGLAAFFMGKRFLSPQINLAFVATITLLPGMIEVSQTARMYVFFITCAIWFVACLFRWERDQRLSSLILATIVWALCLHFHILAIFAAPLFLYPGLSRQSWRQIYQGSAAFVVGIVLFYANKSWISSKYPSDAERGPSMEEEFYTSSADVLTSDYGWLLAVSVVAVAILALLAYIRTAKDCGWANSTPFALVGLGLLAMTVLHYHIAGILFLLGVVFSLRSPELPKRWLVAALILAAVIAAAHLYILHDTGLFPGRKLIGAVIGQPSIWPVLNFLQYSPVAGIAYVVVLLFALLGFTKGRPLPMHIMFFAMSVWAPLLIIGVFSWYMAPRYALGQLGQFMMCVFAGVAFIAHKRKWILHNSRLSRPAIVALVGFTVALINPVALGNAANSGYESHPDHKGAAEFIEGLTLQPGAILIAEDVLQQTYYLGKVDYWLHEEGDASHFTLVSGGRVVDQYTATPVLGTGPELAAVLDANNDVDIYIIGSGENFVGGRRLFRGEGIESVLMSGRMQVIFEGRDRKTKIWKVRR